MFAAFFYLLRQRGLHVSLNEWMTLLEGMEKGLHHSTLTGFYHLCRAIVVKNETEFDRFDQIFLEFFKNVPYTGELPEDLLDWLNHPSEDLKRTIADLRSAGFPDETLEELLKMLEERLKEQTEEHNGGNYWVGTQGRTPWGNSGWHPNGIRIGGQSMHRTAMMVAGERKFRDSGKTISWTPASFRWPSARCVSCPPRSGAPKRSWMWTPRSTIPARTRGGWRSGTRTPGRTR